MLQHAQKVGNGDSHNACNLELPTTQQKSDDQILATVTGYSNENESSDEEDDDQEEKQAPNSEAVLRMFKKNARPGWKDRTMETLFKS